MECQKTAESLFIASQKLGVEDFSKKLIVKSFSMLTQFSESLKPFKSNIILGKTNEIDSIWVQMATKVNCYQMQCESQIQRLQSVSHTQHLINIIKNLT